jgi:hypothetical protein
MDRHGNKIALEPRVSSTGVKFNYVQTSGDAPPNTDVKPTIVTDPDKLRDNRPWALWGSNNNYPAEVMQDLRKSSVLKTALEARVNVHMGSGPLYYNKEVDKETGEVVMRRLVIDQIEEFLEKTEAFLVQKELVSDLYTLANAFPEFIMNKGGKEIAHYSRKKAVYCRTGKQNSDGLIDYIYLSSKWPTPAKEHWTRIKVWNPEKQDAKKFCIPLQFITSDEGLNYSIPHWDAVRKNGWLDVAAIVPEARLNIYKNQSIIKFHVNIPYNYFEMTLGAAWEAMTPEKQAEKKLEIETQIETYLADVKNYGKSIITYYPVDEMGKKLSGIEILVLDNKALGGDMLPDAAAANAEVTFAVGVNPNIVGVGIPGSRASTGSGSYVREELWKMQALEMANRYISLKPLRVITQLNGWAKKHNGGKMIHWQYGDIVTLRTLDQNPKGKEDATLGEK